MASTGGIPQQVPINHILRENIQGEFLSIRLMSPIFKSILFFWGHRKTKQNHVQDSNPGHSDFKGLGTLEGLSYRLSS